MPDQTVIVWDLETVPDLAAAARMLDLGNATEAEVREATRKKRQSSPSGLAIATQFPLTLPLCGQPPNRGRSGNGHSRRRTHSQNKALAQLDTGSLAGSPFHI
jgi:hypothetical protein